MFLITLRNGNQRKADKYPEPYAEKLMIVKENQITPMHYRRNKIEDIINAGGGNLVIKLYNSADGDKLAESDIKVSVDGEGHIYSAGAEIKLKPGQSITLTPGLFHRFWGEAGSETVIVREVSMCNDDANDNCFYDRDSRFPEIDEAEKPIYLPCNEY